jgi:thioesterase-3
MATEVDIKVRGYHLDLFRHVNNARYLEFLEEARWAAFEDMGITMDKFGQMGWSLAVVNINISYKVPAFLGDTLHIVTALEKFGTKSITLKQIIYRKDADIIVTEALVTFVLIDIKTGKTVTLKEEEKEFWQTCFDSVSCN